MKLLALPLLVVFSSVFAFSQDSPTTIETAMQQALVRRVCTIRDLYGDSKLRFDATGKVVGDAKPGFGVIDGSIGVEKVTLHGNLLEIAGNVLAPHWDYESAKYDWYSIPIQRTVTIDFSQVHSIADAEHLVYAVLLKPEERVIRGCSTEEMTLLRTQLEKGRHASGERHAKPEDTPKDTPAESLNDVPQMCFPTGERAYLVRRGVLPPHPLVSPDPSYTERAHRNHLTGRVYLMTVVTAEGKASSVTVTGKALGDGLDEQAVASVRTWQFTPATFAGQPIPAGIFIEVNFKLR